MLWLIIVVVAVFLVFAFVFTKRHSPAGSPELADYERTAALFSPAERSFLGVLDVATGKEFRVLGKVRVADVLAVRRTVGKSQWQRAFNRISRKHFDFVLCARGDLAVLCVIELNDKSHQNKNRQARDEFLSKACLSAGVPLISFDAKHAYTPAEVSARIANAIAGSTIRAAKQREVGEQDESTLSGPTLVAEGDDGGPRCPRCAALMVKRVAKGGDNAGQEFWGCSDFPKCREIVAI